MSFGSALSLLGGAFTAAGQIQESASVAAVEESNAAVATSEGIIAESTGKFEAKRIRKEKRIFTSEQEASFAKAGVKLTGSPLEVLEDTIATFEEDAILTEQNAQIEKSRLTSEAETKSRRAREIREAALPRAAATLLQVGAAVVSSEEKKLTALASGG